MNIIQDGTERLGDPLSLIDAVMPEVIEARRQALNPAMTEVALNSSLAGFPANKDFKGEQTNGNSTIKFEPNSNQKQSDLNCNTPNKSNESSVEVTSNDNNATQAANIPANIDINISSYYCIK